MKRASISEQSVAQVVVAWLEAIGADVYQEVEISGGVADIVARVGAELWIIEVKTTLRLSLITQAMDRRRHAHRVFIAAPHSRHVRDVAQVCEAVGVGLLTVRGGDFEATWHTEQPSVNEVVHARRWNTRPVGLATKLKPEHKTHAKAGAVGGGGRWTPFRNTCEQLARIAKSEPGISLKDALTKIEHHYRSAASARSSIAHWLQVGKVPGVRLEQGTPPKLFPVEKVST